MIAATTWFVQTTLAEAMAGAPPDGISEMLARWFWLCAGLGSMLGIALLIKKLREKPAAAITQPFLVEMAREFVDRTEYERRHSDLENQVKEGRTYAHDEVHAIRGILQAQQNNMEIRNERLAGLEADVKSLGRTVANFDQKLDRLIASDGEHRGRLQK